MDLTAPAIIELRVNGAPRTIRAGATVPDLLADLGLPPQAVLVEHNGVALFRTDWPATQLRAGDQIEIIRVVAGG